MPGPEPFDPRRRPSPRRPRLELQLLEDRLPPGDVLSWLLGGPAAPLALSVGAPPGVLDAWMPARGSPTASPNAGGDGAATDPGAKTRRTDDARPGTGGSVEAARDPSSALDEDDPARSGWPSGFGVRPTPDAGPTGGPGSESIAPVDLSGRPPPGGGPTPVEGATGPDAGFPAGVGPGVGGRAPDPSPGTPDAAGTGDTVTSNPESVPTDGAADGPPDSLPRVDELDPVAPTDGPTAAEPGAEVIPGPAARRSGSARIGFDRGLEGWTVDVAGGTPEGKGSVRAGSAILEEGDSFLVGLEHPFVVPVDATPVVFRYTELAFDSSDQDAAPPDRRPVNDAFEAAVVDPAGRTLVHPFAAGRDAYFNATERAGVALGPAAGEEGGAVKTVTLDVSALPPGTAAAVRFRLVNNDGDTGTSVRILDVTVPTDNRPPALDPIPDREAVEGAEVRLNAAFADPDPDDRHQATIAWGDGTAGPADVTPAAGGGVVSAAHVYADDGEYTARVTVTDAAGESHAQTFRVAVRNAAPVLTAGYSFRAAPGSAGPRPAVVIDASFLDPGFDRPTAGTVERFTATIDWGDGVVEPVIPRVTQGSDGVPTTGRLTAEHVYAGGGKHPHGDDEDDHGDHHDDDEDDRDDDDHDDGKHANFGSRVYSPTVTVRDDDGGEAAARFTFGVARIDVVPSVNPKSQGNIPVKVFSDPGFDAARIDPASLRFGPGGAPESHGRLHGGGGGFVMTHFDTPASRIRPTDAVAFLTGRLADGTAFVGMDAIQVVGKSPPPPPVSPPGATRFFVADPKADRAFRYGPAGGATGSFALDGAAPDVRDVASNAAGDTVWAVDRTTHQVSVYGPDGTFRGSWHAAGLVRPEGLATDGTDVWVADAGTGRLLKYVGAAGWTAGVGFPAGVAALHPDNVSPTGVATDGRTLWVTDDVRDEVFVYDAAGQLLGRWRLDPANADASGLTRDPTGASADLWVVDRLDRVVYRYADGTDRRGGQPAAADTFALAAGNTQPEGIADPPGLGPVLSVLGSTDGSSVAAGATVVVSGRVVADAGASVSTVTVNGSPVDSLDPVGNWFKAVSVPVGTADLVVAATEYLPGVTVTFDDAEFTGPSGFFPGDLYRNRGVVFTSSTEPQLAYVRDNFAGNLAASQPYGAGVGPSGTPGTFDVNAIRADFVVPGTATPATVSSVSVFVGDRSGENDNVVLRGYAADGRLIAQDSFSTGEQPGIDPTMPGLSSPSSRVLSVRGEGIAYAILSADQVVSFDDFTFGPVLARASAALTLTGTQTPTGAIDFALFSDVTASFRGEYGRTSWHAAESVLYADLAVRNSGAYPADAPLLVGITNLSDPTVRARDPDGVTPDGVPYYDFTALVAGGTLAAGELTGSRGVSFYVPGRSQFTYDLVFLGRLNRAPAVTSVPDVEALAGRAYRYDVAAADPDGDRVSFSLPVGPAGMAIDSVTGRITWSPAAADVGTHAVMVRVEDGRGGSAEQRYVLSAIMPPPNRPPAFTSVPVVSASVGSGYAYAATARDPDDDPLTFAVVAGPVGLGIDPSSGHVSWTPVAGQAGSQPVTLRVTDGQGASATQTYTIRVETATGNHPPVIVSEPLTTAVGPQRVMNRTTWDSGTAEGWSLGASAEGTYELKTPGGNPSGYIRFLDGVGSGPGPSLLKAPTSYLGSYSSYGSDARFEWDAKTEQGTGTDIFITLRGSGGVAFHGIDGPQVNNTQWKHFVAPLDPSEWQILSGTWEGLLAEVTELSISLDIVGGGPLDGAIDNFAFFGSRVERYAYDVDALDPDGDPLTYSLTQAPAGMTIDPATGQIAWAAPPADRPQLGYALRFGGTGADYGRSVAIDPAGNAYLTGFFTGVVDFDPGPGTVALTSGAANALFVAKYAPGGSLLWARATTPFPVVLGIIGGIHSAVADADGNLYLAGTFTGTVDFDFGPGTAALTSAGDYDVAVWKMDPAGNLVWARRLGGPGRDDAPSAVLDPAGNVVVVGEFGGTSDFDPGPGTFALTSTVRIDGFAVKLGPAGDFVWAKSWGLAGSGASQAPPGTRAVVDAAGGVLIAGGFQGTIDFDPGPGTYPLTAAGLSDAYLLRLDAAGTFVSAQRWGGGGPAFDAANAITLDRDGNVYLSGIFNATADMDPGPGVVNLTSAGDYDVFVSKLGSDGRLIWARRFGSTGNEGPGPDIVVDGAGGLFLTGGFQNTVDFDPGPGVHALTAPPGTWSGDPHDGFLLKLTTDGEFVWVDATGGPASGNDSPAGLAVDCRGTIYVAGLFERTSDFSPTATPHPLTSAGGYDIFLTRLLQLPPCPNVTVRVEDGRGGFDEQTFTIDLLGNRPPEIVSPPVTTAFAGVPYAYDVDATDPDADPLTYSLATAPAGMTINADTGQIQWTPAAGFEFGFGFNLGSVADNRGGVEVGHGVASDVLGNVYITGAFRNTVDFDPGPGTFNLTSAGNSDTFVAKYTPTGAIVWARRLGGSFGAGNDFLLAEGAFAVSVDGAFNVVVAGVFNGVSDFDPGAGVFNLDSANGIGFVAKLDRDGNFAWAANTNGGGYFNSVATDAVGNVYALGNTEVRKFNAQGLLAWIRETGAGNSGVAVDHSGNVYVASGTILKFDAAGNLLWQRANPGGGAVAIDAAGAVYLAGRFSGTVDVDPGPGVHTLTSAGGTDAVVFKLDTAGNFAWARRTGGPADESFHGVVLDPARNVYATGFRFTQKLDDTGALLWEAAIGGYDVALDPAGGVYTVGDFAGTIDLDPSAGTFNVTAAGGGDIFLARFTPVSIQHAVTVRVQDGRGGSDEQSFAIDLLTTAANRDPVLRSVYDKTARPGTPLEFSLANPGLRAGELLVGNVTAPVGQVKRIDPVTGLQEVLFEEVRQTIPNEHLKPNFIPNALVLDSEGHFWTNSPISGINHTLYSGYRVNPADGSRSEPPFFRVLAQLPSGNYLVQERFDSGLSEHNPVTGFVRTVTPAVIAPPDLGGVALAHLPTGEPLIDPASNVYITRGSPGLYRLNLVTGQLTLVDVIDPDALSNATGVAAADGRYVFVTSSGPTVGSIAQQQGWPRDGRVFRIDVVTGQKVLIADGGLLVDPYGVAVGEDGTIFVADSNGIDAAGNGGNGSVVAIDPVTLQQRLVSTGQAQGVVRNHFRPLFAVSRFAALGGYDPDGDLLTFSMSGLPAGATFDPATRTFRWTPTADQGGVFVVTASLSDGRGGVSTRTFRVTVVGGRTVNHDPAFISPPPGTATVGQLLRYDAAAADPDGDPLAFDLVVRPAGMAIDPTTGVVVWVPTADQVGDHDVTLRVRDGRDGVELQSFRVAVSRPNVAPVITSVPTGPAVVGAAYRYQLHAQDADGDPVAFALTDSPAGMTVDPATGLVAWTPAAGQVGTRHVVITASDGRGGVAAQSFDLPVVATAPNDPPAIASTPRFAVRLGDPYRYQVAASDPNGDPLTYALEQAPAGMTVDAAGLVTWVPAAGQLGPNAVRVRVEDGRGGFAVQGFSVAVLTQAANRPPAITSTPPGAAVVGRAYAYDLAAADPDGDPLAWSLDAAPAGTSIDPLRGTLRWTPTADQVGDRTVVVRVADGLGGYSTQTFAVRVRAVNAPPNVTSAPPTTAAVGRPYAYAVRADDPDGEAVAFSLTAAPAGMTIDPATGLILWTPTAGQVGPRAVMVVADDGSGGTATQTYTVVVALTANRPPVVTSTPPFTATVGRPYSYGVTAADPDGDPVLFSLLAGPAGMTVDPVGGGLSWVPTAAQAGPQVVTVAAVDPHGEGGMQTYTVLAAVANDPPTITSTPLQVVTAGRPYGYDVRAADPDGDPLSFRLDQAPAGMTVDAVGRVRWSPGIPAVGVHRVALTVEDTHGAFVTQTYDLAVLADTKAPRITLLLSDNPAAVDTPVTAVVAATDEVGVASLALTVGGVPVPLDDLGRATFVVPDAGTVAVVATARDAAGNPAVASTDLPVIDPSDASAPVVELTAPGDGDVLSAPADVLGTAADANLLYYTLSVAPLGTTDYVEFARGTGPVTAGGLGRLDTAALANDAYTLRLYAVDAGGNEATVTQTVSVRGDLKLGNFALSFTDLTIPVSGVPITVARTYDTLTAGTADEFGYGWRLEFRDTDLRTSVPKTGLEEYGVYDPFRDGTRVYLTLPGGRREGFTFRPALAPGFAGSFLGIYRPNFIPDPGVTSRLSVAPADLRRYADGSYEEYTGVLAYNPTDPAFGGKLTLTTKDGLAYAIDGATGDLLSVRDANGNTLTFSDAGIVSSAGVSVTFQRDPQGRIVAAVDPAGHRVTYRYDARGDLVAVTDRDGHETNFVYDEPARPHFLTAVVDPLGRTGVRTGYDDRGRLVRLVDAAGGAVRLVHDPDNAVETVLDPLGHPTTFEYDDRGNVVTEVDAEGGVTRRTYDAANNLRTETVVLADGTGLTTGFTYDGDGNVLTETDPLGNVTRFTYRTFTPGVFATIAGARPVTVPATTTDPLGHTTTSTHDGAGNLLTTTDAAGNVTAFTYDAAGNQRTVTDALGRVTRFDYDGRGLLASLTDALGNVTTFTRDASGNERTRTTTLTTPTGVRTLTTTTEYDPSGRPIRVTDAEGGVTRTEYDALGRQSAVIDALGRRTEFRYDDRGQLIEVIFPDDTPATLLDNPRTRTEYDPAGRVEGRTDEAGRVTRYAYDKTGRLTETVYPDATPGDLLDNPRTRTEYDDAGRVAAQVDERGNRTEFEYDPAGRQTVVRDALGHETRTGYDAAGRAVSVTDARGHATAFTLDTLGRQEAVTFADGTTRRTEYNALGRVIGETDQLGRTTAFDYDELGRLEIVTDALGQLTEYTYDEAGNLIRQEDANDHVTRYEYDGLGRRTATVLPLGQRSGTDYDLAGQVEAATDFNGDTILYQYDERGRLEAKFLPDGAQVHYTYIPTGRRETVFDARGLTRYGYDERDRLVARTDPDGTRIGYAYDAAGNRTAVTTPAGATGYTFDELNRTATVNDPAGGVTRYAYDAAGNQERAELPNGTVETRAYDVLNRLASLENRSPSGAVITSYAYTLAATGRRDAVVEHDGRRVDYAYDALDRLRAEQITDPAAGDRTIGYTYDPVGNRLTRTDTAEGLTTYAYDANDRLRTETRGAAVTVYTYDDSGNTLSKVTGATDRAVYTWDAENRLVAADVTDAAGTKRMDYRYDADGIRVSSAVDGEETRFLIDTVQPYPQVLLEYRPSGLVVVSYVYGNDLISQNRAEAKSYYHVDGLGSTRALTDAAGLVTDRYVYEAFGRTIGQTGSTPNSYLFAGEQRDAGLGLDYLRARYLSVGTGRFYGRDPFEGNMGNPITLSPFLYAGANPASNVDPSGRFFAIADLLFATSIREHLATTQANIGFGLLDQVQFGGDAGIKSFALNQAVIPVGTVLALKFLGGVSGLVRRGTSPIQSASGSIVRNAATDSEFLLAREYRNRFGGHITLNTNRSEQGIDGVVSYVEGFRQQIQLYEGSGTTNLKTFLDKVVHTRNMSFDKGYGNVTFIAKLPNFSKLEVFKYVQSNRYPGTIPQIQAAGIIGDIYVLARDGWMVFQR